MLYGIVCITCVDSGDIVDGNMKLILGLMWTLILHYSISLTPHPDAPAAAVSDDRTRQTTTSSSKLSPKKQLLAWINQHVGDRRVVNFTSDWKDGKTLAALVSSLVPGTGRPTVKPLWLVA